MKYWIVGTLSLVAPAVAQQSSPAGRMSAAAPTCVDSVIDSVTGNCVGVSTVPTLGMLLPLGPELQIDQFGQLLVGNTTIVNGAVVSDRVSTDDLSVNGGDVWLYNGSSLGIGELIPQAELHIESRYSGEIIVEADWDNSGEFDHPKINFWQDGGAVKAFVGMQDGDNNLAVRNLYQYGGMRFDLHSSSTYDWEFRRHSPSSSSVDVEARITQSGDLQLDGSVSSPAADLAEFYPVVGDVEPGDLVAFRGEGLTLERARRGVEGRLAGIVSTRPAFTMGLSYTVEDETGLEFEAVPGEDDVPAYGERIADPAVLAEIEVNRRAPLALSGRVPCKVTDANGAIRPGDLLTVSAIPGQAMKATEAGAVVGTALESWQGGEGTILVLANLGWFSPTEDLERRVAELEAQVQRLLRR